MRFRARLGAVCATINGHDKFCCRRCHTEIQIVEKPDVSDLLIALRCWIIPLMLVGLPYELWQKSYVLSGLGTAFVILWSLREHEQLRYFLRISEKDQA